MYQHRCGGLELWVLLRCCVVRESCATVVRAALRQCLQQWRSSVKTVLPGATLCKQGAGLTLRQTEDFVFIQHQQK